MSGKPMYVCIFAVLSSWDIWLAAIVQSFLCLPYSIFCLWKSALSLVKCTCLSDKGLKLVSHQLLDVVQIMNWISIFYAELGVGVIAFRNMGGYFLANVVSMIVDYSKGICSSGFFLNHETLFPCVHGMLFQRVQATLLIWRQMPSTSSLIEAAMPLLCRDGLLPNSVTWLSPFLLFFQLFNWEFEWYRKEGINFWDDLIWNTCKEKYQFFRVFLRF